ncbi:hypothetical protein BU14_0527s0012 [Porphyra umbilicalis]|uniref:Uncharacterized protein n=1 Tax=Porphyra umbilicalis TaxID=2786 RepID=A0A1X6NS92_PORUM|nr:hypothetical protein BU14_0527s0012 [Porphyra umbilicalis]|eukprot:OSX71499.1 hypothetical protein BU14_0527s0012 [Porphyra umbilicalis]
MHASPHAQPARPAPALSRAPAVAPAAPTQAAPAWPSLPPTADPPAAAQQQALQRHERLHAVDADIRAPPVAIQVAARLGSHVRPPAGGHKTARDKGVTVVKVRRAARRVVDGEEHGVTAARDRPAGAAPTTNRTTAARVGHGKRRANKPHRRGGVVEAPRFGHDAFEDRQARGSGRPRGPRARRAPPRQHCVDFSNGGGGEVRLGRHVRDRPRGGRVEVDVRAHEGAVQVGRNLRRRDGGGEALARDGVEEVREEGVRLGGRHPVHGPPHGGRQRVDGGGVARRRPPPHRPHGRRGNDGRQRPHDGGPVVDAPLRGGAVGGRVAGAREGDQPRPRRTAGEGGKEVHGAAAAATGSAGGGHRGVQLGVNGRVHARVEHRRPARRPIGAHRRGEAGANNRHHRGGQQGWRRFPARWRRRLGAPGLVPCRQQGQSRRWERRRRHRRRVRDQHR